MKHLGPGFLDNFTKTLPPDTTSGPPGPCVVARGPGSGKPCVFPFLWNYDGVRYTGCAWDKARDIAPWCSTKVIFDFITRKIIQIVLNQIKLKC